MSHFFTDLREFPVGEYLLSGYVHELGTKNRIESTWEHPDNNFNIATPTPTPQKTGNRLKIFSAFTSRHSNAIWSRPGSLDNTVQKAFGLYVFSTGDALESKIGGIGICLGGADGTEEGYILTPTSAGISIIRIVAGVETVVGTATPFTIVSGLNCFLRLEKDATKVYGKIWDIADPEPGSWDIEATESVLTEGYVGFYAWMAATNHYFHTLSIATDGDAPVELYSDLVGVSAPTVDSTVNGDKALLTLGAFSEPDGIPLSGVKYQVTLAGDPTFASPIYDDGYEAYPGRWGGRWFDLSPTTDYISRVKRKTFYHESSWSVVEPFSTLGAAGFFFTDFREQTDLSVPFGWTPVITTELSQLYGYLYREICAQINTRLGFIVERGKGTLGDTVLRRCSLVVDPDEPDNAGALIDLGQVVYWDYKWDGAGEIADGEIYARIRAQHGAGILFRSNYVWEFWFGTVDASFRMSSHSNDSTVVVGGFVYTFPVSQGKIYHYDWYNIRIRFVGTALKMKIWRQGDVEPALWSNEGTDALWSTGKVGFSCIGNRLLYYGLDLLAAEKSATPSGPFPPPGDLPDSITKPTITDDSIDSYGNVSLECSAFSGDDDAYHLNTRWQVDLSTGDFSDPSVDTQYELGALEEIVIPTLPPNSYKARCLQRDSFEQESSWSDVVSFTVTSRENPVTVDVRELPGDVWNVRDLDDVVFRGLSTEGWASSGPGGSGLATVEQYFDPHLGRYCRRLFIGGSNYQSTIVELFGVSLRALLSPDTPKAPYTYILEDMCKVERIFISQAIQANPERTCFTGVHIDQALNRSYAVNGGHEYLALGFRTHNGVNWQAYMTTYDIISGLGALIKEVDTGKAEEDILWWRIELDGWNKQIRWFVDDVLLTSYSPTLGVMDDYREGGRANGNWCKGEHLFHFRAYPISVVYRMAHEEVLP